MNFTSITFNLEINTADFDEAIESPISIEGLNDTQIEDKYDEILEKRGSFLNISQYTVINIEVYFYNSYVIEKKYDIKELDLNSIKGNVLRALFFKVVPLDNSSKQLLARYGSSTLNKNYVPTFNTIIQEKENEKPLAFNSNLLK